MIAKNPSFSGSTSAVDFVDKIMPRESVDGYIYVKAIAAEITTANMPGALHVSASGWVFDGFQTHAATGTTKVGVCMQSVASGSLVDVAIEGFVPGVHITGTGSTYSTAYSTFTVGHVVKITDTGHLLNGGATFIDIHWTHSTVESTAASYIGVALSSGQTNTVDLWLFGKWTAYCAAT